MLDRRLVTEESAVDDDARHRRSNDVVLQRELSGRAGREVAAEGRLIDVLQTGLEVVVCRAELRRERVIIFVLILLLIRRLRRVDVLS